MLPVFAFTLFISATLLFSIQPMFTKMVLPLLGGTPAVWNTAMMFFQAALLAGYAYAHLTTRLLGTKRQAILHLALMIVALVTLPVVASDTWQPPANSNPVFWLVGLLFVSIGLPFFVIAANAPMLQSWFGRTGHPAAANPYFLYSASNLGSMLALLSYPLLIEPLLRLEQQSWVWTGTYAALAFLTAVCAILIWRTVDPGKLIPVFAAAGERGSRPSNESVTTRQRVKWLVLSFAPSSLLLGVTTFLTTDIAAVPLLWVVPLALYLLTFVIVFARRPPISHRVAVRVQPFFLLPLIVFMFWGGNAAVAVLYPMHLLVFFLTALVCHGELAASRPATTHLTEFYLWLSVGGLLGGVFNALLAPAIFDSIIEYPLLIAIATALRPYLDNPSLPRIHWRDVVFPVALGLILLTVIALGGEDPIALGLWILIVISSLLGMALYSFRERPLRFGLGIGCVLLVGSTLVQSEGTTLLRERNFFGVVAVAQPHDGYYVLRHGTTIHGAQSLDPNRRREPLTYFSRTGPLGLAMDAWREKLADARVAVTGLGAGTIACYAQTGQAWTFYEIDPAIERIARDPDYFNYLKECVPNARVILGDARLKMRDAVDSGYDLIILDAFSSDSVPVHLLTREAVALYLSKLADGGVIVFNISNRYMNLVPVLAGLAESHDLVVRYRNDLVLSEDDHKNLKYPSSWAVMARRDADLGGLGDQPEWLRLPANQSQFIWTDDFSNIFNTLVFWPDNRRKSGQD